MGNPRRTGLAHLLVPVLLILAAFPALAGEYPDKPVTLVVPFPPGGSTHFTAVVLAQQLEKAWGQQVIIETRVGNFGFDAVKHMIDRPDGYTLLVGNIVTNSTAPVFHAEKLKFDYDNGVVPVSRLADFPHVIMTSLSSPANTLEELFDHLKANSEPLRYGTEFLGTHGDAYMFEFGKAAGLEVAYFATRGAKNIFAALVDGKTNVTMLTVATATANMGKFKPLAVTSPRRLANFPDVPTLAEIGIADLGINLWQGLFAPRGTPDEVIGFLHKSVVQAMNSAEARRAFENVNAEALTSKSAEAFAAEIKIEMEMWKKLIPEIMALSGETAFSDE